MIGDITLEQVQKFEYLGSMRILNSGYDSEIKKHRGMAKALQKLELKNHTLVMETKKRAGVLRVVHLAV